MLPAVSSRLASINIELGRFRAGILQTSLTADIHHALFSMPLAVRRYLAALNSQIGGFRAGVLQTPRTADVDHTLLSMLLVVLRHLASLDIQGRTPLALAAVAPRSRHGLVTRHASGSPEGKVNTGALRWTGACTPVGGGGSGIGMF